MGKLAFLCSMDPASPVNVPFTIWRMGVHPFGSTGEGNDAVRSAC